MATILDVQSAKTYAPLMARVLLVMCALIIPCHFVFSQSKTSSQGAEFSAIYHFLAESGIPHEGSKAESAILGKIRAQANQSGFKTRIYPVEDSHEFHSFSNSLQVIIPGKQKLQIALIIPIDQPPGLGLDSYDAFLNSTLGMMVIQQLVGRALPYTIVLDFLGAESARPGLNLGSRCLLLDPTVKERLFNIYLAWDQNRALWKTPHGLDGHLSPAWLLNALLETLEKNGQELEIRTISSQLHRISLGLPNQLGPYLEANIPIVELTTESSSTLLPSVQGNPNILTALINMLTTEKPLGNSNSWDGNYLLFRLAKTHFLVPERSVVIVFMSCMVLFLVVIYFRRKIRHRYLFGFFRNWYSFLIIVVVVWVASLGTGLLQNLLMPTWLGNPAYIPLAPWIFTARLGMMLTVLLSCSSFLRHIVSRNSSFLGASAFLTSLAMVVAVSLYNVTLSIYLLGAALSISFANLSRHRFLKIALTLITGAILFVPLYEALIQAPGLELYNDLISNPWMSSTIITLAILSPVFLVSRIWQLSPLRRQRFKWFRRTVVFILFIGSIFILSYIAKQFTENSPLQTDFSIERRELGPANQVSLLVKGNGPLPNGTVQYHGEKLKIQTQNASQQFNLNLPSLADLQCSVKKTGFLGRKTVRFRIDSPQVLSTLTASFVSPTDIVIHAPSFPYHFRDARNIDIEIGNNPPLPCTIEMTVPADVTGNMNVDATYLEALEFIGSDQKRHAINCLNHLKGFMEIP